MNRGAEIVAADVGKGLVSTEGARRYGVVINRDGRLDELATDRLRAEMKADYDSAEIFNFGGTLEELRSRCLEETGLKPPTPPVFTATRRS